MPRTSTSLLALMLTMLCGSAAAADTDCLDTGTYARLRRNYDDLTARFDLAGVTQRVIDLSAEVGDLKDRLKDCKREQSGSDGRACDNAAEQYAAKAGELKLDEGRLGAALDMHEYLDTLKLRLERPRCSE